MAPKIVAIAISNRVRVRDGDWSLVEAQARRKAETRRFEASLGDISREYQIPLTPSDLISKKSAISWLSAHSVQVLPIETSLNISYPSSAALIRSGWHPY
jgi:hypothetical protein